MSSHGRHPNLWWGGVKPGGLCKPVQALEDRGGGGSGTQRFVWSKLIFPFTKFILSHYEIWVQMGGHPGGVTLPPPTVVSCIPGSVGELRCPLGAMQQQGGIQQREGLGSCLFDGEAPCWSAPADPMLLPQAPSAFGSGAEPPTHFVACPIRLYTGHYPPPTPTPPCSSDGKSPEIDGTNAQCCLDKGIADPLHCAWYMRKDRVY